MLSTHTGRRRSRVGSAVSWVVSSALSLIGVHVADPRNPLGVRDGLHVELVGVMNYKIIDFKKELVVPIAEYDAGM